MSWTYAMGQEDESTPDPDRSSWDTDEARRGEDAEAGGDDDDDCLGDGSSTPETGRIQRKRCARMRRVKLVRKAAVTVACKKKPCYLRNWQTSRWSASSRSRPG
eukprot:192793-Pyramimonas_sp.AAC.1